MSSSTTAPPGDVSVSTTPVTGLHIPPGVWRELDSFTDGAVCVVLASMPYDDADYERDYEEFLNWRSR